MKKNLRCAGTVALLVVVVLMGAGFKIVNNRVAHVRVLTVVEGVEHPGGEWVVCEHMLLPGHELTIPPKGLGTKHTRLDFLDHLDNRIMYVWWWEEKKDTPRWYVRRCPGGGEIDVHDSNEPYGGYHFDEKYHFSWAGGVYPW